MQDILVVGLEVVKESALHDVQNIFRRRAILVIHLWERCQSHVSPVQNKFGLCQSESLSSACFKSNARIHKNLGSNDD